MFKILASYSALSAASALELELDWWSKCDYTSTDYSRYERFPDYIERVVDEESCIKARGKMFHKCDLDDSFTLDRCEMTYGCFMSQKLGSQAQCIAWADKMSPEYSLVDVINGCDNFTTDDFSFEEPEKQPEEPNGLLKSAFLTEGQVAEISGLFPDGTKFTKGFDAAEDGWYTTDFHDKMEGVGPTLTIIKTTTGYVFGGYTDIPWAKSCSYCNGDGNSFLFYFKENGVSQVQKLSFTGQPGDNAETYHQGDPFLMAFQSGIYVRNYCNSNSKSSTWVSGHSYEKPEGAVTPDKWGDDAARFISGTDDRYFQCGNLEMFTVE